MKRLRDCAHETKQISKRQNSVADEGLEKILSILHRAEGTRRPRPCEADKESTWTLRRQTDTSQAIG